MGWLLRAMRVVVLAVPPLACGGQSGATQTFEPSRATSVATAFWRMSYTCLNPGYDFLYDPTFSTGSHRLAPSRVRGCTPRRVPRIGARVVRRDGRHVLVSVKIRGDRRKGGALWLIRTQGGFQIGGQGARTPRPHYPPAGT